jgi:DNA-binding HxlR family transcriptional regulator
MKTDPMTPPNEMDEHHWAKCAAFQRGSELLGKRWTGVILYTLLQKPYRFNELLSHVHGVSDRLLTERLRELEENGLVERKVIPESPVRVEYVLTDAGRETQAIIAATWDWANKWFEVTPEDAS